VNVSPEAQRIARSLFNAARGKYDAGDLDGAADDCRQMLVITPANAGAFHLLGLVHHAKGRHSEGADLIERAMAHNPRAGDYAIDLARVRGAQERWVESAAAARIATSLEPHSAAAHCALGIALMWQGRAAQAEELIRKAIACDGNYAPAWTALGQVLHHQSRDGEAESAWQKAIDKDPDAAEAHLYLAESRLAVNDFTGGWAQFAWRAKANPASFNAPTLSAPQWNGEPLAGKSLLVWSEQGLGEQILFASLIPDVVAQGADVILACERRLIPLFSRSFEGVRIVAREAPIANLRADFQTPIGDLAQHFRKDVTDFPRHKGYLRGDPALAVELRARYRRLAGTTRLVGIVWHSTRRQGGAFKSTDLAADWGPILQRPGVTFFSLQHGPAFSAIGRAHITHGAYIQHDPAIDPLKDVDGWAAQISAMDEVVSVSSTAAHLAGAFNVPCRLLAPAGAGSVWY
jgi:tetratricopeptide (TPR) repeat protein